MPTGPWMHMHAAVTGARHAARRRASAVPGRAGEWRGGCCRHCGGHCQASTQAQVRENVVAELLGHVGEVGDMAPEVHELCMRLLTRRPTVLLTTEEDCVEVLLQHLMQAIGLLLEVLLEVLEEILLRARLLQVVAVDVGPLEHAAAGAHLPQGIVKELQLNDLESVLVVQRLHLALDVLLLLLCQLHAAVVVHKTLEVEHVLVERVLGPLPRPLLLDMLAFLCLPVVDIALVVAACGSAVGGPVAKAQPAELVPAAARLGADHVIAPLVLLYGLVALGAFLGVGLDPADVLGFSTVLDVPLVHLLAVCWTVCLFTARPAPNETAVAPDLAWVYPLILAGIAAAVGIGAPLHRGIVVNVRAEVPLLVFLLSSFITMSKEVV
mmetsp:Transcript_50405/g.113324  ORF Transcript_50405/g.113324 Transcript_50405/m.113324 type:complete len:381 (+) Transcript_50405:89-1231(+)